MTNKLALVVAVVLGVLSIMGIRFYVERIKFQYETTQQLVDVPVAARDIRQGEVVQQQDVMTKQFPRVAVEALGNTRYKGPDDVQGNRLIAQEVRTGQIFQTFHFRSAGAQTRRLRVPPGMRAVTIPVNPLNTHCGMLRPGDYIDLIATTDFEMAQTPTGKPERLTRTFLKNVTILATDSITEAESTFSDYTTLTLLLSPGDTRRLFHFMDTGGTFHIVKVDDGKENGNDFVNGSKLYDEVRGELQRYYGR